MKKTKILLLIVISCAFALPAFAQKKVDIFGYYTIVRAPKAFADISEVHLAGDAGEAQRPRFYGLIRMKRKAAKDFHLLRPTLTGRNFSFKTKNVSGIRYEFLGMFMKLGNFPVTQPEGQVLLKGKLIKYRGKRKIAEAKVSFSYTAGD